MNANELNNWLPVLRHPEYGEAICEAAGVNYDVLMHYNRLGVEDEEGVHYPCGLPTYILSAICFGVVSVLRRNRHIIPSSLFFLDDHNYSHESVLTLAYHSLGIEVDA